MATATTVRTNAYSGETLRNVDWATYCQFRDDPANSHLRMTYLDGNLTLMSPHMVHDFNSRMFVSVVTAVCRAYRIQFMPIGTTTLKQQGRGLIQGAGKEPDEGFFLRENVARMIQKKELDLAIDPSPDLAIEIDNSVNSRTALEIYARIGVPEVWRFNVNDQTLWFGWLDGGEYRSVDRSPGLPRLTPELVMQALEDLSGRVDWLDWLDWLDGWARNLPEPN